MRELLICGCFILCRVFFIVAFVIDVFLLLFFFVVQGSFCYLQVPSSMASQIGNVASLRAPQASKTHDYYPLWKYVTNIQQMPGGGTWEWRCNLCKNSKTYKGSYTRVKAHILHEGVKGVDVCSHTSNPKIKAKYKNEHDDAQRVKDQRAKFAAQSHGGTSTHTTRLVAGNEPRIVQEARKRRAMELEGEMANPTKDSRLVRMFNNQGREEAETRVARAIYACGIPFNVVRFPYWQDMVRAINTAP